jgi:hypothetical protein
MKANSTDKPETAHELSSADSPDYRQFESLLMQLKQYRQQTGASWK